MQPFDLKSVRAGDILLLKRTPEATRPPEAAAATVLFVGQWTTVAPTHGVFEKAIQAAIDALGPKAGGLSVMLLTPGGTLLPCILWEAAASVGLIERVGKATVEVLSGVATQPSTPLPREINEGPPRGPGIQGTGTRGR